MQCHLPYQANMIFAAFILGILNGWLICWFSDLLPHLTKWKNNPVAQVRKTSGTSTPKKQLKKFTLLVIFVMLITAVLYTYLFYLLQFSANFFFLAGLCTFLILIAVIDLKYQIILNIMILPAIVIMLLYQFSPTTQASWYALLGGFIAFLLFLGVGLLSPGGLGGGDIKLAAFLGVTFGLPYVFWALVAGVLTGGITAVFLLIVRQWKPKTAFPYGPFLCFGAIVALLFNPLPWLFSLFA